MRGKAKGRRSDRKLRGMHGHRRHIGGQLRGGNAYDGSGGLRVLLVRQAKSAGEQAQAEGSTRRCLGNLDVRGIRDAGLPQSYQHGPGLSSNLEQVDGWLPFLADLGPIGSRRRFVSTSRRYNKTEGTNYKQPHPVAPSSRHPQILRHGSSSLPRWQIKWDVGIDSSNAGLSGDDLSCASFVHLFLLEGSRSEDCSMEWN